MTLQEILKAKGLSDEDIESVVGEMKQNKIFTTSHENMDVRYPKLKADHETLTTEHGESTKLIEQLKAGSKDNEALQAKIAEFETTVATLQAENAKIKLENEAKLELIGAKAIDVDYMLYKLMEKGNLELDENGKIKDIADKLAGLKTEHPAQFESAGNKGREIDPQPLPEGDKRGNEPATLAEAIAQNYNQTK
jgi:hypothetical protein